MPAASTVKITVRLAICMMVILSSERVGSDAVHLLAALRTKSRSSAVITHSLEVVDLAKLCQE
jgi:hypothetical protein